MPRDCWIFASCLRKQSHHTLVTSCSGLLSEGTAHIQSFKQCADRAQMGFGPLQAVLQLLTNMLASAAQCENLTAITSCRTSCHGKICPVIPAAAKSSVVLIACWPNPTFSWSLEVHSRCEPTCVAVLPDLPNVSFWCKALREALEGPRRPRKLLCNTMLPVFKGHVQSCSSVRYFWWLLRRRLQNKRAQ